MTKKKSKKVGIEKNPFKRNKYRIIYQIIDCLIAGSLVFIGALSSSGLTKTSLISALFVSLGVAFLKFQNFYKSLKKEFSNHICSFLCI
jgi:uncharacterized membrane protein